MLPRASIRPMAVRRSEAAKHDVAIARPDAKFRVQANAVWDLGPCKISARLWRYSGVLLLELLLQHRLDVLGHLARLLRAIHLDDFSLWKVDAESGGLAMIIL